MKIKNVTHDKVKAELLAGSSVDHGFGGEYDFNDVVELADITDTLRLIASKRLSRDELADAAEEIKYLLSSALLDAANDLVISWDE